MYKQGLLTLMAVGGSLLLIAAVNADAGQDRVKREVVQVGLSGIGPGEGAVGEVLVLARERGPDTTLLRVRDLPSHSRISVFLTERQEPGGLPAQFVGEFTTNEYGEGRLLLLTEVVNAFASANQALENADGVADVVAGLLVEADGTANTIPLNWFRGYFVPENGANVFGTSENVPGGPIAFVSTRELP